MLTALSDLMAAGSLFLALLMTQDRIIWFADTHAKLRANQISSFKCGFADHCHGQEGICFLVYIALSLCQATADVTILQVVFPLWEESSTDAGYILTAISLLYTLYISPETRCLMTHSGSPLSVAFGSQRSTLSQKPGSKEVREIEAEPKAPRCMPQLPQRTCIRSQPTQHFLPILKTCSHTKNSQGYV